MQTDAVAKRWQTSEFKEAFLRELIPDSYSLDSGRSTKHLVELFDDFDRGLTYRGLALVREQSKFRLVAASDLNSAAIPCETQKRSKVVSWQDFSPGAFQSALKKRLGLRAATCLCTADWSTEELCVRNEDDKIVARFWIEKVSVQDGGELNFLSISPLLGYEVEAEHLAQLLSSSSVVSPVADSLALLILSEAGKAERPLSSKSGPKLEPGQPAADAVGSIAALMVQVARQNELGIVEDIDTEFLHEYRVSIRKLRSVLELIKGVYERSETRRLRSVFGDFAKATNRLRDLDVYLLEEDAYRERLSPWLRPGLDRLFADFRTERKTRVSELRKRLRSQSYKNAIAREMAAFSSGAIPVGPKAERPIFDLVKVEIRRHYKQVRKRGKSIDAQTPDEDVHELRIECKKLRYLLELFGELFAAKPLAKITRALKRLQTVLGQFNDFSVQQESMQQYLVNSCRLDNLTAAAVGALIESLHLEQRAARAEVVGRFKEFDEGQIPNLFSEILSTGNEVAL